MAATSRKNVVTTLQTHRAGVGMSVGEFSLSHSVLLCSALGVSPQHYANMYSMHVA